MPLRPSPLRLPLLLLLALLGHAAVQAQSAPYRYATITKGAGSTFYALDGHTGQLYYMTDFGEPMGEWNHYGLPVRSTGRNNLQFEAVSVDGGGAFYALEGSSGQLFFMHDFGEAPGVWKPYGLPILQSANDFLQFRVEQMREGCKFTAIDGNTGQLYYMYDFGDDAGSWKPFGGTLK